MDQVKTFGQNRQCLERSGGFDAPERVTSNVEILERPRLVSHCD